MRVTRLYESLVHASFRRVYKLHSDILTSIARKQPVVPATVFVDTPPHGFFERHDSKIVGIVICLFIIVSSVSRAIFTNFVLRTKVIRIASRPNAMSNTAS